MNDIGDINELRHEIATLPMHGRWTRGGPVFSQLSHETVLGLEAGAMSTFGDSGATGLWAFATGAWISGLFQADILPLNQLPLLFPALLVYAGVVEFVAGLLLFRRNNAFLASALCSFGGFNMTRGVLLYCAARGILPHSATASVLQGCLIESFAYVALSLLLASVRMNAVLALLSLTTAIGFGLGGITFLSGAPGTGAAAEATRIGGWFLFAAGAFAYYGGTAMVVNSTWQRAVLPLGGRA